MEFDPGHAAFSYPSRPCKLDRSFSWTGTTKSPNQFSSNNDLSYEYGSHSQTLEFFDVPSMFEDALRQLTSSPTFAYPPNSFQTNNSLTPLSPALQNSTVQTKVQHTEDSQGESVEFSLNNYQELYDAALSLDPQQDFSSHLWPTLTSDNEICSSPLIPSGKPSGSLDDMSEMPSYQLDQFIDPSSIVSPDHHGTMASLETIDEEIGCTFHNMACQQISQIHLEGAMWSEPHDSQKLSSSPFHLVENESYGDGVPCQPLQTHSLGDVFNQPWKRDYPVNESALVLVKVNVEVRAKNRDSTSAPPQLNDLISKFDSNPASPLPKRTRRRYTELGKTKVKQVRISGACIICKARKVPVSLFATSLLTLLTLCGVHQKELALHVSNWHVRVL
jgi:hypothetical protein